jgi:DnaJ-class molecular chaperone
MARNTSGERVSLDEYYRRLELPHTASPAEIKRAYRRLRAKYHPDRNKGREAAVEPVFKRVQEAFEILIGERSAPVASPAAAPTSAYSREKERPKERPAARQAEPDWVRFWQREDEAPQQEARSRPPIRGANCLAELFVPVETAIQGGAVDATIVVNGPCGHCTGLASHGCPVCRGTRLASQRKTETVQIAAGAWDGQRLQIAGAGHPGVNGGPAGDAIFTIVIVCGAAVRRDGLNVACDIQVDFVTAMLGGGFQTQALGRAIHVTISPNAQAGSAIRIRGQGLTDRHGARGDLTLHLSLTMPAEASHLTQAERQKLREMFAAAQHRAMQESAAEPHKTGGAAT